MSTIQLSPAWTTAMVARMFRLNDGQQLPTAYGAVTSYGMNTQYSNAGLLNSGAGSTNYAMGGIFLMKGTVPTDGTSLTSLSVRTADTLVKFTPGANNAGDFITSQVSANPAVISTQYSTAVASGTATWFLWFTTQALGSIQANGNGNPNLTTALGHCIIGTIGASGSGADLEMPSPVVVTGEQYRISNLRIQFPDTWTY